MTHDSQGTVTRLLAQARAGHAAAMDELLPLIYDELRSVARRHRRRWRGDSTLGTTALVHEAYLKLVDQGRVDADTRAHFLGIAAKAMRHILCNHARDRRRQKRGGDLRQVDLEEVDVPARPAFTAEQADILAALDEALRRLEAVDKRHSAIVECRFFGGLSIEETAAALALSPATVKRGWSVARAWLYREMQSGRS